MGRPGLVILALAGLTAWMPAAAAFQAPCDRIPLGLAWTAPGPACTMEKPAPQVVVFQCGSREGNDRLQQSCEELDDTEQAPRDAMGLVDPLLASNDTGPAPEEEPSGPGPGPDTPGLANATTEEAAQPIVELPEPLREASDAPPSAPAPQDPPGPIRPAAAAVEPVAPRPGGPSPEALARAGAAVATVAGLLCGIGAFYNRLNRDRVGSNPVRSQVLDVVRRLPGSTPAGIARALGIHPTTVVHHLRVLARFGHVAVHEERGRRSYFEDRGRVPVANRRAWLLLRRPGNAALVEAVRGQEALRLGVLARALGVSASTAGYRATQLLQAGLLERREGGWRLSDRAHRLLGQGPAPASKPVAFAHAPACETPGPALSG